MDLTECYEDLNDFDNAGKYYEIANSYTSFLSDDGYGKMIKGGIIRGIERVKQNPR